MPHYMGSELCYLKYVLERKTSGLCLHDPTKTERNDSQLEKEGLALLFGIKKCHVYIFGRNFTLCTDHKPPRTFSVNPSQILCLASVHIQRWVLTLPSYEYMNKYKSGPANSNADALSHLLLPATYSEVPVTRELVLLMEHTSSGTLTAA